MRYEIRIRGYIKSHWFERLENKQEANKTTLLSGNFKDQAELYGVLKRIQELGIELISISPIEEDV